MTTRDEARERVAAAVKARMSVAKADARHRRCDPEREYAGATVSGLRLNDLRALLSPDVGPDQPRPSVSEDQGASRDHALTDGVALVKCGSDLWISRELVQSLEWDRRHYMNGPGSSTLVITMADGAVHRIKHEPGYLDGTDAYAIERALTNA